MNHSTTFRPGFRLSVSDGIVLVAGLAGALVLGIQLWWWAGMIVGIVVFHFFLFCNVFRISRASELIWAGVFVLSAGTTIVTGFPGWVVTFLVAPVVSSFLIWRETKRESYHGIYWEKWNPALPDWWKSKHR